MTKNSTRPKWELSVLIAFLVGAIGFAAFVTHWQHTIEQEEQASKARTAERRREKARLRRLNVSAEPGIEVELEEPGVKKDEPLATESTPKPEISKPATGKYNFNLPANAPTVNESECKKVDVFVMCPYGTPPLEWCTEVGTVSMHPSTIGKSREEIVKNSRIHKSNECFRSTAIALNTKANKTLLAVTDSNKILDRVFLLENLRYGG